MEINTLKGQVESVLHLFTATRNSDIALTIQVWQNYYPHFVRTGGTGEKGIWLKDLYDLPRESEIGRVRRFIQNDETRPVEQRYLPTDWEVAKQRKFNEELWRQAMQKINPQ